MDQQSSPRRAPPVDAFPEIAPLIAAAKADGIDARAVLARVITDLFVSRSLHVEAELTQFVALIEPLIRAIDTQTAVAVARKLAAHAETPRTVIEALLARNDEASHEMLRCAAYLDLHTLDILAERGSRFVALAIACRVSLSETTARILASRNEAAIDRALACPREPALPGEVISLLAMRARDNPDLARLVLAIPSLPFLERCALFPQADPQERAGIAAEAARRAFLVRSRPSPFMREGIDETVFTLRGKGSAALAEALAGLLGLPAGDAGGIVGDSTGEALALALRACGARAEPIVALLLSRGVHLSRSVERIFALDRLARETSEAAAATILAAFAATKSQPPRQITQQSQGRDAERTEPPQLQSRAEPQSISAFKRRERAR